MFTASYFFPVHVLADEADFNVTEYKILEWVRDFFAILDNLDDLYIQEAKNNLKIYETVSNKDYCLYFRIENSDVNFKSLIDTINAHN